MLEMGEMVCSHSQSRTCLAEDKVGVVEQVQVLRTFGRPDQQLDLALAHEQFLRPQCELAACSSRAKFAMQPIGGSVLAGLE